MWDKQIGFDFDQATEDEHASLDSYDAVIDCLLEKYESSNWGKAYQCGNTSDHRNRNIEIALQSGAKRILNSASILQQTELLSQCKGTCFEVNPIFSLVEGGSKRGDLRLGAAPVLLGLGFPVSIGWYLGGSLGFESPLWDLFACAVAFHWSLKHLKLIQLHSITYALATEGQRARMFANFNRRWEAWIAQLQFE